MKNKTLVGFIAAAIFLGLNACETDDVNPTPIVSLTANQVTVSENGGVAAITANLTNTASADVEVSLTALGTAINGADYNLSAVTITIPAGSLTGSVSIIALQDTLEEGDETIGISIDAVSGAETGANSAISITIEDDDVAATARIIINEVLYDPSNSGLDGDANGDGVYGQDDDSFIEFINLSTNPFDLVGYEIWDDTASGTNQYTFPANSVIPAGKVLVVFGGGIPTGSFGGAVVQNAGSGFNFNNSGEVIGIKDPNGGWVLTFNSDELSNNPNESITRNPDITGSFEQHSANTPLLFSPGTRIDGSSF